MKTFVTVFEKSVFESGSPGGVSLVPGSPDDDPGSGVLLVELQERRNAAKSTARRNIGRASWSEVGLRASSPRDGTQTRREIPGFRGREDRETGGRRRRIQEEAAQPLDLGGRGRPVEGGAP